MEELGETTTEEVHTVFFSGKEDKHEHVVGFLVHKDIVNALMECRPVSNRLTTIHLRNITIVQAYAQTSDYHDTEVEELYEQLQNVIYQTPKKDILVVQGDWTAKVGKDACGNWQGICGPFCNDGTNERRLSLLNRHLKILFGRTLLVITKHPEYGPGIAQMDNTTTKLITF